LARRRLPVEADAVVLAEPDEAEQRRAVQMPEPAPEILARPDAAQYSGRVALNPACFSDVAGFPGSCRWLDRQSAVEAALGDRRPQEVRFTSPLVGYAGKPVPR